MGISEWYSKPSFRNAVPIQAEAVIHHKADMGIAFDGDFDRCFLFDNEGNFIEGYYIVGLLAESFLEKQPGARIIHDPRLSWNTIDVVLQAVYSGYVQNRTCFCKRTHAFGRCSLWW